MPDPKEPISFTLNQHDLEKLKSASGGITLVKGVIKDGKFILTGVQQEFSSPFRHDWPPKPDDDGV